RLVRRDSADRGDRGILRGDEPGINPGDLVVDVAGRHAREVAVGAGTGADSTGAGGIRTAGRGVGIGTGGDGGRAGGGGGELERIDGDRVVTQRAVHDGDVRPELERGGGAVLVPVAVAALRGEADGLDRL